MVEVLYLAKPRGFCAGVVMAIEAVEQASARLKELGQGELPVYHSIVHNNTVVSRLREERQVHFVERLADLDGVREQVASRGGRLAEAVVFSAHGVSPAVRADAAARGLTTIDATCPLVTKVHSEAKKYASRGYSILLIGDSLSHQEVIGTRGEAFEATTVVGVLGARATEEGLADVRTVEVEDPEKVVVLTQTTLSVDDVKRTIEVLKRRFPNLVVPPSDDLCYATKNRQDAVKRIAEQVDLFLVVTSNYSSNGTRLLELADDLCGNARAIESVRDVQEHWLDGVFRVGITSAASTPDDLVQDVVAFFQARNSDLRIVEEGEWENITFRPPKWTPAPKEAGQ